ncbi:MAG: hypothetical protein RL572_259 [Pseudomonadota bacterium]
MPPPGRGFVPPLPRGVTRSASLPLQASFALGHRRCDCGAGIQGSRLAPAKPCYDSGERPDPHRMLGNTEFATRRVDQAEDTIKRRRIPLRKRRGTAGSMQPHAAPASCYAPGACSCRGAAGTARQCAGARPPLLQASSAKGCSAGTWSNSRQRPSSRTRTMPGASSWPDSTSVSVAPRRPLADRALVDLDGGGGGGQRFLRRWLTPTYSSSKDRRTCPS